MTHSVNYDIWLAAVCVCVTLCVCVCDVGCICWCTVHGLACLYCPRLFFSTAHRALVFTRGSRLIRISLSLSLFTCCQIELVSLSVTCCSVLSHEVPAMHADPQSCSSTQKISWFCFVFHALKKNPYFFCCDKISLTETWWKFIHYRNYWHQTFTSAFYCTKSLSHIMYWIKLSTVIVGRVPKPLRLRLADH